jgi:endonuclease YncB( thermonuclease family)
VAHATPTETIDVPPSSIRVIDGDTIAIGDVRVRLMGYDTPETHRPSCAKEAAMGNLATMLMRGIIADATSVTLDVEEGLDRYDRALARITIDGRDPFWVIEAAGLARHYDGGARPDWCAG